LDHINPEAKGGTWNMKNLNPACYECNQAKGDLSVEQFRSAITLRSNPNYVPALNHKAKRAIRRLRPGGLVKLTQSIPWQKTIKKFPLPVTFFFEQSKVKEVPTQDLLTSVMALLAPRNDSKPRYCSMAGFGFNQPS
jgi:hypothetical protein